MASSAGPTRGTAIDPELHAIHAEFWLEGPLLVTPLEQLDFLRRFETDKLPISPRTRDIVREILIKKAWDSGGALRGKTGWAKPSKPDEIGWFVGYVDKPRPRYVAVLLQAPPKSFDMMAGRQELAEEALRSR